MANEDVIFKDTEDVVWAVGQDVDFVGQILIVGGRRIFIFDNARRLFSFDNARRVLNFDNVRRILEIS